MTIKNNPYIGPRTFEEDDRDYFFGRDVETRDLLSLVISEPLVLFYAQSGAGKSSLINTALIPALRDEGFIVLPKGRLSSGVAPDEVSQVDNIFVYNLLLSLDQSQRPDLANLSIAEYLRDYKIALFQEASQAGLLDEANSEDDPEDSGEWLADPYLYEEIHWVLIIDQFEEIMTAHTEHWAKRDNFFYQLRQAMDDDPNLWVIFSLREDYLATLDPYARHFRNKFRARFRLEPLKRDEALKAITHPAQEAGRTFMVGVAEGLVDNLRRLQAMEYRLSTTQYSLNEIREKTHPHPKPEKTELSAYIQPVHLQIVCHQLWEHLPEERTEILPDDVREFGDVDQALIGFYEQTIGQVIRKTHISERRLRDWFDEHMITPSHTRGLVYRGKHDTVGLANEAVDILLASYLLRSDIRGRDTWHELSHDRLIEPITMANRGWYEDNQRPITLAAQAWDNDQRSYAKLYQGQQLRDIRKQLKDEPLEFSELEKEFIEASNNLSRRMQARNQQLMLMASALLLFIFAGVTIFALEQQSMATYEAEKAEFARQTAEAAVTQSALSLINVENQQATTEAERDRAATAQREAIDASSDSLSQQSTAVAARITAEAVTTLAIQQKQTAEAESKQADSARQQLRQNLEYILELKETPELIAETANNSPADRPQTATTATPTATSDNLATQTFFAQQLENLRATETAVARVRATEAAVAQANNKIYAQATETFNRVTKNMVKVPGGQFEMGSLPVTDIVNLLRVYIAPSPETDEFPQRTVYLDNFWIDETEVTNQNYNECIQAGGCTRQTTGDPIYNTDPVYSNYPVVFISWREAKTFCEWAGKRLPTEAEWEKAARSTDGRIWPWGNQLKENLAQPIRHANVADGSAVDGTTPVFDYSNGRSPYGALNMSGNVWEWVNDWYDPTYYARQPNPDWQPRGPSETNAISRQKVVRGGSFKSLGEDATTTERNGLTPNAYFDVGFRCAWSSE